MDEKRKARERRFWDSYAHNYDPMVERLSRAYSPIFTLVREHVDPSTRLLDVATGTGVVALNVAGNVHAVEACDLSPKMIALAERKQTAEGITNVHFSVQDAYDMAYPDATFDVVVASNLLHVLISPERALASIARVMKPRGLLVAPTYCHGQNLLSHTFSRLMSLRGFRAHHRWSCGTLRDFFETQGFCVLKWQVVKGLIPLALPLLLHTEGEAP